MSRPEFDLSVYLVTDTAQCGGPDGVVETVRRAIVGGVTLYPAVPTPVQRVADIERAQMMLESPQRPALQALIDGLGLARSVRLLGQFRYEQTDPARFYGALAADTVTVVGSGQSGA